MSTALPATSGPDRDMSDWLSPMIIKELRQGLRGRVFVLTFLALQAILIFTLLAEMTAQNDIGFFWAMIGIALLVVLPLRGLGAIGLEMRAQTMELIVLTRLSALRIVFGKWGALFAQTLLFVTAVLPYLLLRYYVAGAAVIHELGILYMQVIISAMLSAATVGLSAHLNTMVRLVGAIILIFVGSIVISSALSLALAIAVGSTSMTSSPWEAFSQMVWLSAFGALFVWLMLEVGAHRLAPPSENHPGSIRLAGLGFLVIAPLAIAAGAPFLTVIVLTFPVILFVCIHALVEEPVSASSITTPFVRRGSIGTFFGRFFYPGWPSGIFYTGAILILLFVITLISVHLFAEGASTKDKYVFFQYLLLLTLALFGTLLLPTTVTKVVAPDSTHTFMNFLWLQVFFALLAPLVTLMDTVMEKTPVPTDFAGMLTIFPPCTAWLMLMQQLDPEDLAFYIATTGTATLILLILALWRAFPHYRRSHDMEREARRALATASEQDGIMTTQG